MQAMEGYCKGLLQEVQIQAGIITRDIDQYLAIRRETIAVYSCLALAEQVLISF